MPKLDPMSLAQYAQRSALFSVSLLVLDLAVYAGAIAGIIAAESIALKLILGVLAGTMIALSAIVGHDAGHQSLSGSKNLNRFMGTLAFLPALHPFCLWEHHHNRVHHRFTAQLGLDNAFPPMTVDEFHGASAWTRAKYRFLRSLWGQPFFYLVDVWLLDMWLPFMKRGQKMTPRVWFDLGIVYAYFITFVVGCTALTVYWHGVSVAQALATTFIFAFAVPFLVWNAFISFLSIVQHTGPEVKWVRPTGRPSTVEQALAGTVHIVLPEWVDRFTHRIMQHQAHHVHVGIPLQQLVKAQKAVAGNTGSALVRVWTPAYHLLLTQQCQLYDPDRGVWLTFAQAMQVDQEVRQAA